jgi:hypothetical protein
MSQLLLKAFEILVQICSDLFTCSSSVSFDRKSARKAMLTQHCGSIEQNGGRCAQMQKCSSVGKNTSKKMQKVKNIYRLLRGGTPSQRLGCQIATSKG